MKGTVVSTWINSLRVIYGDSTVNAALRKKGKFQPCKYSGRGAFKKSFGYYEYSYNS